MLGINSSSLSSVTATPMSCLSVISLYHCVTHSPHCTASLPHQSLQIHLRRTFHINFTSPSFVTLTLHCQCQLNHQPREHQCLTCIGTGGVAGTRSPSCRQPGARWISIARGGLGMRCHAVDCIGARWVHRASWPSTCVPSEREK